MSATDLNTVLATVERAAREQNGWRVIAAALTHEGGDGYVPHGVCAFARDRSPLGEGREYGVANFNLQGAGVTFDTGDYDLERAGALAVFVERLAVRRDRTWPTADEVRDEDRDPDTGARRL